jgi:hypothetical protein
MACNAQALGTCSEAEGNNTVASGDYSLSYFPTHDVFQHGF